MTHEHVLVVGGTGMLRGVCLALAPNRTVSVVARDAARLAELAVACAGGRVHPIALDYRDTQALTSAVAGAVARFAPVATAVCWIHSTAPDAPLAVGRAVANPAGPCRFVHVLGSAAADPSRPDPGRRERFEAVTGIRYQEVILGFVVERGVSRWLTDDEICRGVLAAIEGGAPRSAVGTVDPWSARP